MLYVILIAAIFIFWLVVIDRPILNITFKDGKINQVKGHLPNGFKHQVTEIAESLSVEGQMKVYRQRTGMKLNFSKNFPKKAQQRIKSVFPYQGFQNHGKRK